MNYKKIIYSILILMLVTSCMDKVNNSYVIIDKFPKNELLKDTSWHIFKECYSVIGINKVNDYLLMTNHKDDYFLSLFDMNGNRLCNLCHRGKGHNEYISIAYTSQYYTENGYTYIWVVDRALSKAIKINIEKSIVAQNTIVEENLDLHKVFKYGLRNIFCYRDSILFGTEDLGDCKRFKYHIHNKNLTYYNHSLQGMEELKYTHSQNMYSSNKDKIVYSYFSRLHIDIFDMKTENVSSIFVNEIPNCSEIALKDDTNGYRIIKTSTAYIFALTTGTEVNDYIHVFDWNSVPVACFKVGKIGDFAIDEKGNRIIAVNSGEQESPISFYKLPAMF